MDKNKFILGIKDKILIFRSETNTNNVLLTRVGDKLSKLLEIDYDKDIKLDDNRRFMARFRIYNNSILSTIQFTKYKTLFIDKGNKLSQLDFKLTPLKYLGNSNWLSVLRVFGISIIAYNDKPIIIFMNGKELKDIAFKISDDKVSIDTYISFTILLIRNQGWKIANKLDLGDISAKVYQKREKRKNYAALDITGELNVDSIEELSNILKEYINDPNYNVGNWSNNVKYYNNRLTIEIEEFTLDIDLDNDNIISVYNKIYTLMNRIDSINNRLFEIGASIDNSLNIRYNMGAKFYDGGDWTQEYVIILDRLIVIGDGTRILRVLYLNSPIDIDKVNLSNASGILVSNEYNKETLVIKANINDVKYISCDCEISLIDKLRLLRATRNNNEEKFETSLKSDDSIKLIYYSNYMKYNVVYGIEYGEVIEINSSRLK